MSPGPCGWGRVLAAGALLLGLGATGGAQTAVVADPGPGRPGRDLRAILARPHRVIVTSDSLLSLPRDSVIDQTIVIIGAGRVTVASRVAGSVIVVGSDLFLHPGVDIAGDAIAFGGGVYTTALGVVRGRVTAFRDFTFAVTPEGGDFHLRYREIAVQQIDRLELPGPLKGFRIPSYDRTNGLSLPWGPRFNWVTPRITIDPVLTYRSDLGEVDPHVSGRLDLTRTSRVLLAVGRSTLTNEGWIRGGFLNSLSSLATGSDVRNYRRATRLELFHERTMERGWGQLTPRIGLLMERARSVGPGPGAMSGPWSLFQRTDTLEGMRRPNPAVIHEDLSSVAIGSDIDWEDQEVRLSGQVGIEGAVDAPGDARFAQATVDGRIEFPAFRNHSFRVEAHALITAGDPAPPQRFSYLGGSGTLPTVDLLSMGGDQLLFLESRYTIPIDRISVKFLGSPSVMVRHMIGAAGVDRLPGFVNNLGVRLAISLLKADFVIDPETRDTEISIGVTFGR
jgi:hypothetical protein